MLIYCGKAKKPNQYENKIKKSNVQNSNERKRKQYAKEIKLDFKRVTFYTCLEYLPLVFALVFVS